jgi:gliding motility-associated-like protein
LSTSEILKIPDSIFVAVIFSMQHMKQIFSRTYHLCFSSKRLLLIFLFFTVSCFKLFSQDTFNGVNDLANINSAYSLRLIMPGYRGPIIQVVNANGFICDVTYDYNNNNDLTNDSEATVVAPGNTMYQIGDVILFSDFLATTVNQFAYVQTWYDQSSNPVDLISNGNIDNMPTIAYNGVINTLNGMPTLDFSVNNVLRNRKFLFRNSVVDKNSQVFLIGGFDDQFGPIFTERSNLTNNPWGQPSNSSNLLGGNTTLAIRSSVFYQNGLKRTDGGQNPVFRNSLLSLYSITPDNVGNTGTNWDSIGGITSGRPNLNEFGKYSEIISFKDPIRESERISVEEDIATYYNFTYLTINNKSFTTCNDVATKSFTIQGLIQTNSVSVTSPTGYNVSLNSNLAVSNSINVVGTNGIRLQNSTINVTNAGGGGGGVMDIFHSDLGHYVFNILHDPISFSILNVPAITSASNFIEIPINNLTAGDSYSVVAGTRVLAGFSPVTNANFNSFPLFVGIPASSPGTYDFEITFYNSVTGCFSQPSPFQVVVTPTPTLNNVGFAFTQFSSCTGSVSASQSFTVSGSMLTNNIVVTAPNGFEVSLSAGSGYLPVLSIPPVSGTVANTTVFMRLASSATNGASGRVTISSSGAITRSSQVLTAVVNALPTITGTTPNARTGTGTVALAATASSGSAVDWYSASSGGTSLATGTSFTTPSISSTTTYYVEARNTTTGCLSAFRTAILATVSSQAANDADGDGVSDTQETSDGTNANDGCSYLVASQIFANTTSTWRNTDCDGDGVANGTDTDPLNFCVGGTGSVPAFGTPEYDIFRYQDCDNDGILNGLECSVGVNCPDFDNDGIPNYLDTDSDNDQIGDIAEGGIDSDGDGSANYIDLDSDGDGILDIREKTLDQDGDGTPNYLDFDSDGDNILDKEEARANYNVNSLTLPDTDNDGTPDFLDLESDGDGILDIIESAGDFDGDQHPNYRDGDSDGDGISDSVEKFGDMDGDGKPNFLDLDSDGDGITDQYEGLNLCENCGRVDNNDDGYDDRAQQDPRYPSVDTDKDGTLDFLDLDADNDGIPDAYEAGNDPKNPFDTDQDGIPDFRDIDIDNDGILDSVEAGADPSIPVDTDKDGTPDFRDLDSDNDGISDALEAGTNPNKPLDSDADGIYDFRDLDSDADGISDSIENGASATLVDTDNDGIPNYLDNDSDNDGIADKIEKGLSAIPADTDQDGTPDFRDLDSDNDGISDIIEKGSSSNLADTDGDGVADFIDLDSDNDGISDKIEKGLTSILVDTDLDGLPDFRDLDSDGDGISDNIEKGPTATPVDTDGDGLPDYLDLDTDGDTLSDKIEKGPTATPMDTDKDGIPDFRDKDSDNDGTSDLVEAGPDPKIPMDTDKDGIYDYFDSDADNDGILDIDEDNVNISGLVDCDKDGIPNRLDADKCPVFLPQGISPNGDGKNDTFIIPGILSAQPNTLTIFNRLGRVVYEKDNYQNDWNGGDLPDGTYLYIIDYKGKMPTYKSYLYINRLK